MQLKSKFALLTVFFVGTLFLTSCSTTRSTMKSQDSTLAAFDREDYYVLPQVEGKAKSTRVWFLFIPIGGKSDEKLEKKAFNKAIKQLDKADGLIDTRYEHKKIVIPLILFTPVIKKTTAVGRGYRLKTDAEMRKNN